MVAPTEPIPGMSHESIGMADLVPDENRPDMCSESEATWARDRKKNGNTKSDCPKRLREVNEKNGETSMKRFKNSNAYVKELRDSGVRMAITTEDYPATELDEDIYNDLQIALLNEIEKVSVPPFPQTHLGLITSGIIYVWCIGEHSVQFLRSFDGQIVKGVKLKILNARELTSVLRPIKMAWKTKSSKVDVSTLLRNMQRIYPELKTEKWRIVDSKVEDRSTRYILYMDEASADYIRDRDYRLSTGIYLSYFKRLGVVSPPPPDAVRKEEEHDSIIHVEQIVDVETQIQDTEDDVMMVDEIASEVSDVEEGQMAVEHDDEEYSSKYVRFAMQSLEIGIPYGCGFYDDPGRHSF